VKSVTCVRIEDALNELDVLPVRTVLEALPECLDDRQVFDALVALVPVAPLDCSEILPLESSRIRSSTGDVGDLGRIDADDFEGIGDGGVGTGVPPAKYLSVVVASVESLCAEHVSEVAGNKACRLLDGRNEPLASVDASCSVEELLHQLAWNRRGTRLYVTKHSTGW